MNPKLQAIYDELPAVACTGQCFESCSFIGTFRAEREQMVAAGRVPPRMDQMPCPWLDFAGRCSGHELRPLICRLYGVTEELACPFGCKAERTLTRAEARRYMERVDALLPFPRALAETLIGDGG